MRVAQMLATLVLLVGTVMARKSYLVKEAHRGGVPKLRSTDRPHHIFHENNDDHVTVYYQGQSKAGWEWAQVMNETQDALPDVYHLTLDIQLKNYIYFSPIMSFPRAIYIEPIFEVKEFTFGYKFDIAYFWEYTTGKREDLLCVSSMLVLSAITRTSTLVFRLQECYKTLINCIYNLEAIKGEDAKYFDKCSQSGKTTITTYNKESTERTWGVLGSADDDILRQGGSECKPGKSFLPIAIGDIKGSYVAANLLAYMADK